MERTIILLTGTPGAGKTTVAETLCTTFSRSAHVPVDYFRKLIKTGYASPHHWNDEVERQYGLARKNAALTARNIALEGFTVIIDDIVRQKWVEEWQHNLAEFNLRFVLLLPSLEIAKQRNQAREIWTVDEAIITKAGPGCPGLLKPGRNGPSLSGGWGGGSLHNLLPVRNYSHRIAGLAYRSDGLFPAPCRVWFGYQMTRSYVPTPAQHRSLALCHWGPVLSVG